MTLHIYNTLSRALEPFKPLRQDEVKVYYCGPTPYNYAHIGNLRSYLFEDFTIRTLRFLGYRVKTVMNVTDIDDKTIRDSRESGKTLREFTEYYTAEFLADLDHLHIERADTIAPISGIIPEMAEMIQGLIDRDFAYVANDGSVYYRVAEFATYGELAHLDMAGMISNVRINNDEYDKDQIADFALWKAYDPGYDGENYWDITLRVPDQDTPIVLRGRPGWHIECSACNYRFFGEQIDIHMGGIDNLFPHHQNEVAQTEAFTGKTFSRYWMHGGHLLVDNKKMSKSAKNFYTLRDVVRELDPTDPELIYRGFRLMALQNQYRENFNFTFDRLEAAINTLRGLDEMLKRLARALDALPEKSTFSQEFRENQQYFAQRFVSALEDDIDTITAMTVVFEYQSYVNTGIDAGSFSEAEMLSIIELLKSWNSVIAILDFSLLLQKNLQIPEQIRALADARIDAKKSKNWSEADRIRDEITALGWQMIDEKDGSTRLEPIGITK